MDSNLSAYLKSNPALRAVGYCRVSTKEQQDGYSLEMQSRVIEKFAQENGIAIIQSFGEAASASKGDRPEFKKMMRFLADNDAANPTKPIVVLVEKSDRFGRNMFDLVDFLRAGYKAVEVKAGSMISQELSSRETKRMLNDAVDNQSYSHNLSEEVRKGLLGKAQEGYYPYGRKFGYDSAKDSLGKNTMTPDPMRAPLVTQMFADFATGEYSLKALAKRYRDLGLTIRKSGKPLTFQQIHTMLRDKAYAGFYFCGGTEFKAIQYEPLVSLGIWQQIQEVLDNRSKTKKPTTSKWEFTYSRLFTCQCGCLMCGESKKDGRYVYFHCTNGRGKHSGQKNIPQGLIDEAMDKVVERISFSPVMIQLMQASHEKKFTSNDKVKAQSIESIERQIAVTKTHLGILLEKLLTNVIGDDQYRNKELELKGRLETLTLSLKTQRSFKQADAGRGNSLCQIIQSLASLYPNQPTTVKRRFWKLLINKATLGADGLTIEFKSPFDRLLAPTIQVLFKKAA